MALFPSSTDEFLSESRNIRFFLSSVYPIKDSYSMLISPHNDFKPYRQHYFLDILQSLYFEGANNIKK